jgi:hypothetical protein
MVEVCDRLQDAPRAEILHRLLLPYSSLTVIVGNATVCLGATSRFLGQLATVLARWELAETHFEHALGLNLRMGAAPWLAHTRFHYARMLLRRGRSGDTELAGRLVREARETTQQLGMRALQSRIEDGLTAGPAYC